MRRAIILAALLVVTVAAPAGAQEDSDEPIHVCTEVSVPEGSPLESADGLRGEPPDGECDMVVYLPVALFDVVMLSALMDRAEDAAIAAGELCVTPATLDSAGGELVPCDEL